MNNKCEFIKAWTGKCNCDVKESENFCSTHLTIKCSICGGQAKKECSDTISSLVCATPICNSDDCFIQHQYREHSMSIHFISLMEEHYKLEHAAILIARINNPVIKFFHGMYKFGFLVKQKDGSYEWSTVMKNREIDTLLSNMEFILKLDTTQERKIFKSDELICENGLTEEFIQSLPEYKLSV